MITESVELCKVERLPVGDIVEYELRGPGIEVRMHLTAAHYEMKPSPVGTKFRFTLGP